MSKPTEYKCEIPGRKDKPTEHTPGPMQDRIDELGRVVKYWVTRAEKAEDKITTQQAEIDRLRIGLIYYATRHPRSFDDGTVARVALKPESETNDE